MLKYDTSHKISFPNNIKTNFEGYNLIINKLNECTLFGRSRIELDFTGVNFFDANFTAIIGVYLEIMKHQENIVIISNLTKSIEFMLRRNTFLCQFGFLPLIDSFQTSVPYKRFRSVDSEGFQNYIIQDFIGKPDFPKMTEELGKKLVESVFEIYVNACSHGLCNYIHTCGQIFGRQMGKPLQFCIVDSGKNIKENVSEYKKADISSVEAIKWAMELGNTTKTQNTGGLGLGLLMEFIELNKGTLQVISSDGFYEFKGGNVTTNKLESPFLGTIVNLTINLADNNTYYLSNAE